MKFNWGTGLVIGMVAFISFIMYFVVTMMSGTDYDHDLVVEDYYREELHYQQDIDAQENALAMEESVELERKGSALVVVFPGNMNPKVLEGKVKLYRPSNKKLDFELSFSNIEDNRLHIPESQLVKGRWNVMVSWKDQGKEFLFKEEIIY